MEEKPDRKELEESPADVALGSQHNPDKEYDPGATAYHQENGTAESQSTGDVSVSKFENPLSGIARETLFEDVEKFCQTNKLEEHVEIFKRAALAAQNPRNFEGVDGLEEVDKDILRHEVQHKWSQPFALYNLVVMCSLAAAVQGMDETVNNGAQSFYLKQFGIKDSDNLTGLVVGAPYLACATIGCWITEPLNRYLGRRGTIWISCFVAAVASIWEGVCNSWVNLFLARFVLGLGIGPKSSTVPIYTAECSPAPIRGALVMMWQMWTAFGIMLGNIMGVAFGGLDENLGWRLMLGSTVVLPLIVCAEVYFCPESPRWLIEHKKINKAFRSFQILRGSDLRAARDLYYACKIVELERKANKGKNFFSMVWELFTVPRNARATWASFIVMFLQQFCGVNVIAYYSTTIFTDSGYSLSTALLASMGTGILNFLFAIPAFLTIDTWGRRSLLLCTLPCLAICLLWTGFSFFIKSNDAKVGMVTTGMYLFEIFYSPGEGPVPFTYSAEAFPLHVREVGMSWATAVCWCFNFVISFSWPHLMRAFKPQGAFGWYAAWCLIGWCAVLLFLPETKERTLEELDQVFSIPSWKHASYHVKLLTWQIRTKVFKTKLPPIPPLWEEDNLR